MNNKKYIFQIKNIAGLIALAIFFLADRYLKVLAIKLFSDEPHKLFGNFLTFNFTPNYNIAFSLPLSGPWLSILIGLIILAILGYLMLDKNLSKLETISLLGIIVGASSNLIDRLQYGYVVDYFDLKLFTVFNLADVIISVSTLILLIYLIRKK